MIIIGGVAVTPFRCRYRVVPFPQGPRPEEPIRAVSFWKQLCFPLHRVPHAAKDRKSTRLNSSHVAISYAVFCLKKKIFCTRSTIVCSWSCADTAGHMMVLACC